MNISVWAVVLMLFGHWVADFVWQPDWMGKRKSSEWWVLSNHASRITFGALATGLLVGLVHGQPYHYFGILAFGWINGAGHFLIDAVTSRITKRYWSQDRAHAFFTTIGFDQFLHLALAVFTLAWLVY